MLQCLRSRAMYDYYSVFVSPMIIKYKKKRKGNKYHRTYDSVDSVNPNVVTNETIDDEKERLTYIYTWMHCQRHRK